jgi:hypothetical protein
MAAKLNRLILQLRAMRTKMMLADAADTDVRSGGEQRSKTTRPPEAHSVETPRRPARRRAHG